MKLPTIGLASIALAALAACNTQQAANDSADNAATEGVNAVDGTENVADGDKPADEAAAGNQTSTTGDKPPADSADDSAGDDEPAGDKPVE